MAKATHVFLSYCRDDKDRVRALRHDLVNNGFAVWWDDEILPGQDWNHEIRKAMAAAYAVVICLSRSLADRKKSGVFPEIRDAIAELRKRPTGDIFVIPVRLNDCDVPDLEIDGTRTLKAIQSIDLFPEIEQKRQLPRLFNALKESSGDRPIPDANSHGRKSRVTVTIDMEMDDFDKRAQNTLRHGLANFLDVPADEISIREIKEGSVKVTFDLPERAARRLMLLRNEPGLAMALEGFSIKKIETVNYLRPSDGVSGEVDAYPIGMDGNWALETLGDFSRLYSQVYSVMYALNVAHSAAADLTIRNVFQAYPWRGGFSRLNFYRSVRNAIPPTSRPRIRSIQYASPGEMVLTLVPSIARMISTCSSKLIEEDSSAHTIYKEIDRGMVEHGLKKTHVRGESDDDEGKLEIRTLTEPQLAFVQQSLSRLARELEFNGAARLSELTGNRLAALKILMSFFRRMRDLVALSRSDLIEL